MLVRQGCAGLRGGEGTEDEGEENYGQEQGGRGGRGEMGSATISEGGADISVRRLAGKNACPTDY